MINPTNQKSSNQENPTEIKVQTTGYKKTEVGVIPEDWDCAKLEEFTKKIGSGITPTGGSTIYKEMGRPFVRSQNIGWGNLILNDIVFIDEEIHQTFPNTEINIDDVFLNISGASIGRSSYANHELVGGNVNQHVCIIRTKQDKLNPIYLNLFLLSRKGQKQIDSFQSGGNREGLNIGQIKTFNIPLPPTLAEQRAIAKVLSDTDALIQALEKKIAKKKLIKKGVMQKLLTPKEGWEEVTIQELIDKGIIIGHLDGNHGELYPRSHEFVSSGIPYVGANNFSSGEINYSNCKYLTIERANTFQKGISQDGDVLFAHNATVGPLAIVDNKYSRIILSTTATYYRCDNQNLLNTYLFYFFQSPMFIKQYQAVMMQSTRAQVPITQQRKFSILLPSFTDQTAIASTLSAIDFEIKQLEQKLSKYKQAKQGMMQQLLTGKIRLV